MQANLTEQRRTQQPNESPTLSANIVPMTLTWVRGERILCTDISWKGVHELVSDDVRYQR